MKSLALAALAILWMVIASAQDQEHDHEHSDALGEVHFPISCNEAAQALFNKAMALVYSFYWERVDPALVEVLEADPTCAMAYWAKAVASLDNPLGAPPTSKLESFGWGAVQKAKELGGKNQREHDYISTIEVVFKDYETVPFATRALAYEKALEQLYLRYPNDSEAAVLYGYWLQVTADRNDQSFAQQLKSAAILHKVFDQQPKHPGAAHFLIHAYDFPALASLGFPAAKQYAAIAPDSPHALHMPSHIFSRSGHWQDSIDANIRSRAAAKLDRDIFHALDYMVYAALQLGRDAQVRQWLEFVNYVDKPNEQTRQIAYAAAAIPARYALERGEWRAAAQLKLHPSPSNFDWSPFPEGEAVNAYARGLGAARSGDVAAAQAEIARLQKLRTAMAAQKKDYWVEQAGVQADAINAWIARAQRRNEDAARLMRAAADREDRTEKHIMMPGRIIPVREMLGELLLELKRPAEALLAFERSQEADPNRFRNVYGAARAAELMGDRASAKRYYGQFRNLIGPSGAADRDEVKNERAFAADQ